MLLAILREFMTLFTSNESKISKNIKEKKNELQMENLGIEYNTNNGFETVRVR